MIEQARPLEGRRAATSRCPTRAPCSARSAADKGALHGQLDLHLQQLQGDRPTSPTTSARPATRETVAGEQSEPPIGGINVGVSAVRQPRRPGARRPSSASPSARTRCTYADRDRQHAGQQGGVRRPELQKQFPADLLDAVPAAASTPPAPRTGLAVLERHLQRACQTPGTRPTRSTRTPRRQSSATFIEDVLQGKVAAVTPRRRPA